MTERQAELLLGEGRHPDADRIERELLEVGADPAKARRVTVMGRHIEYNQSAETENAKERRPWLAMDLVFRAPSTAHIAWALGDDETRPVLDLCQDIARDETLAWLEDAVAEIRWKSGGKNRAPVRDGLIVAVFTSLTARPPGGRRHGAVCSLVVVRWGGREGGFSRGLLVPLPCGHARRGMPQGRRRRCTRCGCDRRGRG
ncbi:relaxase domain-containing protein [Streptomyces sp. NBC_00105]|uniref:relaxase domain-containing protein n=1 Tax=Streptomyces sp. NBC_00105 TaxID=2903622 RepID=UPI0038647A46